MEATTIFHENRDGDLLAGVLDHLEEPVYFYAPVFADGAGSPIVDLVIVARNRAADAVSYGEMMSLGVLASSVFTDMELALIASQRAWDQGDAPAYRLERSFELESGTVHYVYDVVTFRFDDHLVQVCSDRTTSVAVERSELFLRQVLDTVPAGVSLLRPVLRNDHVVDAHVEWRNAAARNLWLSVHQLVPMRAIDFKGADRWIDLAEEAWQEGRATDTLELDRFPGASWRTATQTLHRVGNRLLEFTVDLSWEYELLEQSQAAENLLRTVVENLGDAIAVHEPVFDGEELVDLRYAFVNSEFARLHPSMRLGTLASTTRERPAEVLAQASRAWACGNAVNFSVGHELDVTLHRVGGVLLEIDRRLS